MIKTKLIYTVDTVANYHLGTYYSRDFDTEAEAQDYASLFIDHRVNVVYCDYSRAAKGYVERDIVTIEATGKFAA